MGGLYGACNGNSAVMGTLSGISFSIRGKRFVTVINPSNSNGSALLRVLNNISIPASKGMVVSGASVSRLGRATLTVFHHHRVNLICRFCGLVPVLAIRRGLALPLLLSNGGPSTGAINGLIGRLNLRRELRRLPGRLSNNRRREISVNETLVGGPTLLLTSRPANGLSDRGDHRVVSLLHHFGGRDGRAIVVVARSRQVTLSTSEIVTVRSNGVIESRIEL